MAADHARVAIVDLDNTLVRGSTLFHFGVHLVRTRRLAARHVLRFAAAEAAYAWAHVEPSGLPADVAQRGLGLVRGWRQSDVRAWAAEFAARRLPRHLDTDVVLAVQDLRRAGFSVHLATASPQELAEAVADALGLDGAIGTVAEVSGGCYTGELAGPIVHGAVKDRLVRALLAECGADAREAFAFSDSITDLPMLSSVGNPVAVNPGRELHAIAAANGWRVLRRRDTATEAMANVQVLFPHPY